MCTTKVVYAMGTGGLPRNAVDLDSTGCYYSECQDSWICYDFKNWCVIPKSYSMRSYVDGYNLKSWIIEVSNDGYSWKEIDRQENNNYLNDNFALCNFRISEVSSDEEKKQKSQRR